VQTQCANVIKSTKEKLGLSAKSIFNTFASHSIKQMKSYVLAKAKSKEKKNETD